MLELQNQIFRLPMASLLLQLVELYHYHPKLENRADFFLLKYNRVYRL